MADLTVTEIQIQCHADSEQWFPKKTQDIGFIILAACGEMGEAANVLKKVLRSDTPELDGEDKHDLVMELTDVFIYLCNAANALGVDLGKAYEYKRGLNVARFNHPTSGSQPSGADPEVLGGVRPEVPGEASEGGPGVRTDDVLAKRRIGNDGGGTV